MNAFKVLCAGILVLALSPLAPGQSLAEAAKKEKERRESLKGKSGVVVTNANLGATKKKPALAAPAPTESGNPSSPAAAPATTAAQAVDPQAEARKEFDEKKASLEERLAKMKEMVELLTLKMKALQQQFYSFNSMQSKEQVQMQISDTFQRLQAAQAAEKILKDELDQLVAKGWKSE